MRDGCWCRRRASGAVSRSIRANDAPDYPEKKSQCGRSGVRAKAGGFAVARADERRAVSLCTAEEPRSEVFAVARASDGAAAQERSGERRAVVAAVRTRTNASYSLATASAGAK